MHEAAADREFPSGPPRRPRRTARAGRLALAGFMLAGALAASVPTAALAALAPTAALAALAPATAHAAPRPSSPASRLVPVGPAPRLPSGDRTTGDVPATAEVTGTVALRLSNPAAVTAFIDAVSSPRSPAYHKYLARGEFTRRFGPAPAAVAAVARQLRDDRLTVTSVSANHLLIGFRGTAARAEAAFGTRLQRVALAGGGTGQAATSAVSLPASIAPYVTAVLGLNRLTREHSAAMAVPARHGPARRGRRTVTPAVVAGGPVPCAAATALRPGGALTLDRVATAYGLDPLYAAGNLAATQTVDVIEFEPFDMSDVAAFDMCYFGADRTSQITVTPVDGGPGTGPGSGEAALDIEDIAALAPGAQIHVFQAPNMNGMFTALDNENAIAIADDAGQVSTSWGLCEASLQQGAPGAQQVENEIFAQIAAQGQTVFAASGDDGSDSCAGHAATPVAPALSVLDPASQPYVTSVGGTTITNASQPPQETVWNNGNNGGAAGGGLSATWAMPSWQDSVAVPQTAAGQPCSNNPLGAADDYHVAGIPTTLPAGTSCRETPDVSALADPQTGVTILYDGSWTQSGGTSSAAPLWASMLAEISASSGCPAPHGVGFAEPLFYQVASTAAGYADTFNDVTAGDNDNLGVGGGLYYPAASGYDLASGLGTPRVTNASAAPGLAAQLCAAAAGNPAPAPVVTSLTQLTGTHSVAGGGTLQIAGSGFGATAGSVFFGAVSATVVSWSDSAITVGIPPYYVPGGTPSGFAGRANVTVVTAGRPHQSSAPGSAAMYQYTADSAGSPAVDYVSSPNGPVGGGNTVHIIGAALTGATAVSFGDVPATSFTVLSANDISATVPASDGNCAVTAAQGLCAVAVTVTTPSGTSAGPSILPAYQGPIVFSPNGAYTAPARCGCEIAPAPQEYDYAPAPVISSVSPAYASENGNSVAVIAGSGFNLLTFQYANIGPAGIGFSQNFGIVGVTPTQLAITLPAAQNTMEPLAVPLSVQSAGQLSNVSTLSYAGIPVLTSISKHLASQANPGTLTITGQGLIAATSVVLEGQDGYYFLTSSSTAISSQTDTSLTVVIPHFFQVPADVLVCTATGCSDPDPPTDTLFLVYAGQPVVNSSSPPAGPAHGGTTVTIQGALDSTVTAVDFGSVAARILSQPAFTPSGPVTVVAPPGTAGTRVSITITTLAGTLTGQPRSAVNPAAAFTYQVSTPTPPIGVAAAPGVRSATVSWGPPRNNGGSPLTLYRIVATARGQRPVGVNVPVRITRVTIGRLAPGVAWTFTVYAGNRLGLGLPAVSRPVVPRR
jgi:Pro-kumamolisin, activation domain/Fibronectin type III domain/IPT/TIG domain